jgi:TonB family protein
MRSSLIISLSVHLLISLIAFHWVSFRSVKYIPRQVYNVTLVDPVQAEPVKSEPTPRAPEPEPEKQLEPEPEPEEELPPPPVKPKKKPEPPKPKPRKEVPKTDIDEPKPDQTPDQTDSEAPAETGEMSLDTDDFPFAPYINRVRRKIAANWRVPEGSQGEERFCRVYFRIQRDGSVTAVGVEESSGLFMFDQAAQRAVVNATPLPPLPREYRDHYLGVHFSFVYREKR